MHKILIVCLGLSRQIAFIEKHHVCVFGGQSSQKAEHPRTERRVKRARQDWIHLPTTHNDRPMSSAALEDKFFESLETKS